MDELERFKTEIDLTAFAASRGYRVDRRESTRGCIVLRHHDSDDKILVSRAKHDGHWIYYSVRDPRDHGSIVDFVLTRDRGDLGDVRRTLSAWLEHPRPLVASPVRRDLVGSRDVDRAGAIRAFERARVAESSAYLESRGICSDTLKSERFSGTFRVDARGNVLFPHSDGDGFAGFESKNLGWTSYSSGGVRALWRSNVFADDTDLVLVESAIDALSFHQVNDAPRVRYASTAGALSIHQQDVLRRTIAELPPTAGVALAFDRDPAGERLADQVRALCAAKFLRVCPPIGKDWNDYLKVLLRGQDPSARSERGLDP
jgi:hypothetical protein